MTVINVRDQGVKVDGSIQDAAMQAAINAANGGKVFVPQGNYNVANLSLPMGTQFEGEGRGTTTLFTGSRDLNVLSVPKAFCDVSKMSIYGKGMLDTGAALAGPPGSNPLIVAGFENKFHDLLVWGGFSTIYIPPSGTDNDFEMVNASESYGNALVTTQGGNWFRRCKFDQDATNMPVTSPKPYLPWQAGHGYTFGNVVSNSGYLLQCLQAGLSGSVAPVNQYYGKPVSDGSAKWMLLAPASYDGIVFGNGTGETHLTDIDLTGPYTRSLHVTVEDNPGLSAIFFTASVFSQDIDIANASHVSVQQCEIGGNVNLRSGYGGSYTHTGNKHLSGTDKGINVESGVRSIIIGLNEMNGSPIHLAGSNVPFNVTNNINTKVLNANPSGVGTITGNT